MHLGQMVSMFPEALSLVSQKLFKTHELYLIWGCLSSIKLDYASFVWLSLGALNRGTRHHSNNFFSTFAKVSSTIWINSWNCNIMETKLLKLLKNVKDKWIFMLNLAKNVMVEYKTLLLRRGLDIAMNFHTTLTNLELILFTWHVVLF